MRRPRVLTVLAAPAENLHFRRHAVSELQPAGAPLPTAEPATSETSPAARPPLWLVPPVLTLAVMLWGIQGASYSRDESATMSAVQRPFHGLLRMLGNADAVHGVYYAIIWPIVHHFGPGELATRLPSALAMAVAAAAIFGLGQRLVSPRAGLAAGLVFAILPEISVYGQTARPYAMATALAAIASYLLVRAVHATASGHIARTLGWLLGYGACLAALGYIHPFGLLLIAAHVVLVARACLRHVSGGRNAMWLAVSWLLVVAGVAAAASPVIRVTLRQDSKALTWVHRGSLAGLSSLTHLIGPQLMAAAALVAVVCGIAVSAFAGPKRMRVAWPGDLIALCVPWLILPGLILMVASMLVTPIYVFRYVIFCAPAAALLVGAGLAALGWRAGTAALAILAVLAVPTLRQVRTAGGHGDDIRGADRIVAAHERPGDAFLYQTINEPIQMAYPYGLRHLTNVLMGATPNGSGTLGGTWAPLPVVRQRVKAAHRIWLVQLDSSLYQTSPEQPPKILRTYDFSKARAWHTTGIWVTLYVRG